MTKTINQLVNEIAEVIERPARTGTELLAAIGVHTEPHPEYGCKMLFAGKAVLGPMDVRKAYVLLTGSESAA